MRFDPCDRGRQIHARGRSVEPRRERCIGHIRMADGCIKRKRQNRNENQYAHGSQPGPSSHCRRRRFNRGFRRHQAAGRFGLGALRIFRRNEALRFIPFYLGELGLVECDADFAARNPAWGFRKRP